MEGLTGSENDTLRAVAPRKDVANNDTGDTASQTSLRGIRKSVNWSLTASGEPGQQATEQENCPG